MMGERVALLQGLEQFALEAALLHLFFPAHAQACRKTLT